MEDTYGMIKRLLKLSSTLRDAKQTEMKAILKLFKPFKMSSLPFFPYTHMIRYYESGDLSLQGENRFSRRIQLLLESILLPTDQNFGRILGPAAEFSYSKRKSVFG